MTELLKQNINRLTIICLCFWLRRRTGQHIEIKYFLRHAKEISTAVEFHAVVVRFVFHIAINWVWLNREFETRAYWPDNWITIERVFRYDRAQIIHKKKTFFSIIHYVVTSAIVTLTDDSVFKLCTTTEGSDFIAPKITRTCLKTRFKTFNVVLKILGHKKLQTRRDRLRRRNHGKRTEKYRQKRITATSIDVTF